MDIVLRTLPRTITFTRISTSLGWHAWTVLSLYSEKTEKLMEMRVVWLQETGRPWYSPIRRGEPMYNQPSLHLSSISFVLIDIMPPKTRSFLIPEISSSHRDNMMYVKSLTTVKPKIGRTLVYPFVWKPRPLRCHLQFWDQFTHQQQVFLVMCFKKRRYILLLTFIWYSPRIMNVLFI